MNGALDVLLRLVAVFAAFLVLPLLVGQTEHKVVAAHDLSPVQPTISDLEQRTDIAWNIKRPRGSVVVWHVRTGVPHLQDDLPLIRFRV